MINFVEIEIGGDSWNIGWDLDVTSRRVVCTGKKFGSKFASYSINKITPSTAFDMAMTQLSWLKKELKNADKV